ncbi:MAG: protein of unknown function transrane [Rhizobacter sp.]|nr:protein of unknown function transrane [Rhizobacter sp.]
MSLPLSDARLNPAQLAARSAGIAAGLAAGALWGLVFIAPRVVENYGGVELTAGRFAIYGAVAAFLMLATLRRHPLPTLRQAGAAAALSVLGFTGYYLLLAFSIRDAGSEVPTLIIGTIPLAVMLLGKPHGLRWRTLVPAIALTVAGLFLMMRSSGGFGSAESGPHFARGLLLAAAAMASWTVFAIGNAAWLKKNPDVDVTAWTNWLGVGAGAGGALLWLAAGPDAAEAAVRPDRWLFLAVCVATGFGSAWLATVLWNIASVRLPASLCGQLIVSETLFGLLYSFMWDQHLPSATQLVACVLFMLGIVVSIRAHR